MAVIEARSLAKSRNIADRISSPRRVVGWGSAAESAASAAVHWLTAAFIVIRSLTYTETAPLPRCCDLNTPRLQAIQLSFESRPLIFFAYANHGASWAAADGVMKRFLLIFLCFDVKQTKNQGEKKVLFDERHVCTVCVYF